jgi:membrane associated rhomboid family serine protease
MGLYDREYIRRPADGSAVGRLPALSVATWLIVINVAVFVLDRLGYGQLTLLGYFSADTAIYHLQVWRFITFQFLHANLSHIFFNMLALYFFGPMVESYLGRRRFLAFYLLCGAAGAATYLALWQLGLLEGGAQTPLVGASAGIFGVLIAGAAVAPDARVMLLFPPIPMKLKVLAWVLLGIAAFTVVTSGPNAGGQAAHLGGAALGAVLIRRPQWLNFAEQLGPPGARRRRFFGDDWRR